MIACGTLGRGLTSIVATRLFEAHGLTATAILGAAFAVVGGCVDVAAAAAHSLACRRRVGPPT